MAGDQTTFRTSTHKDGLMIGDVLIIGVPLVVISINGNMKADDEWALFRLTDEGLSTYEIGYEFAAGIMSLEIEGEPAVVEISRHKTKEEAAVAKSKLSPDEQKRTLLRSVRPKSPHR